MDNTKYVMVPVEPTEEMIAAGWDAARKSPKSVLKIYRDVIAAAQPAQKPEDKAEHPCANRCQYSVDVGMYPEHSCSGECQYEKHGKAEQQASLCDIVAQVRREGIKSATTVSQDDKRDAEIKRLRDALTEVRHWFEAERKSISKGNGSQWSMWQCEEQMEAIDAAIRDGK